jgi:2-polyprenyl-6-methoxyphenol hydroxylase-like FAD-dependent oxidoreductase
MGGTFMATLSTTTLKVLVVGAGLGGLTLAQSLRRAGIDVQIFERDKSPWDRPQGYRLHLDADAINAAHEVLTPQLSSVFDATSQRTEPFTTLLKTDLSLIKRLPTADEHDKGVWPPHEGDPTHNNVDRATLRQILLTGLDDVLRFGKQLKRYEGQEDKIVAHFEDGTSAEGSVLVGADGILSAVRAQRAPHAQTVNSGVIAIYGRLPLEKIEHDAPPEALTDIFTVATDERKVFLGLGSVRFPTTPEEASRALAPATTLKAQKSYMVCIVGGRPEFFPRTIEQMRRSTSEELREIAAQTLGGWPDRGRSLVRRGDPASFFLVEMYTSVPCSLDAPSNVTFVGDAIHAMTPTLGRGANVAMRDGALLARALKAVQRGEISLKEALLEYERSMLSYGFGVVREAAQVGNQRMAQNPLPE